MKDFKTMVIKTKFFSGKINTKEVEDMLHKEDEMGWKFEGTLPIVQGFIFKKIHQIMIFSK